MMPESIRNNDQNIVEWYDANSDIISKLVKETAVKYSTSKIESLLKVNIL